MKILKIFTREKKKKDVITDLYQDSVNKMGREQFKKILERGLQVPVVLL